MWRSTTSSALAERSSIAARRSALTSRANLRWVHWVALVLAVGVTFLAAFATKVEVDNRAEARFSLEVDRSVSAVDEQLRHYEDALWAGVAAIQANGGDVSHEQWTIFARTLRIVDRYPGANGIGVIHSVPTDGLDDYLQAQRSSRPDFTVHPQHEQSELLPITHIEPLRTNRAAVGLDMAHETNRYGGISRARDTGLASMTGPIALVQDEEGSPGFLFFAPWYRQTDADEPLDRHSAFVGAVYAPFVVSDLITGSLEGSQRLIGLTVRDEEVTLLDENTSASPSFDADPMFEQDVTRGFYGRTWQFTFRTTSDFRAGSESREALIVLVAGLVINLLIFSLFLGLTRSNRRALRFADDISEQFLASRSELETSNSELERFAYVASHDLKTPLRGIASLTEWIEEDLEPYLELPDRNEAVVTNLGRIRHQIDRMNALITGLLRYATIEHDPDDDRVRTFALARHLDDLVLDLGLEDGALVYRGPSEVETSGTMLLMQVISNLVGNAVAHHTNDAALHIEVSAVAEETRLVLNVTDNGPGIATAQHDRIFEVFQTLEGEGTGIGLSVVRKIIDQRGGEVRLRSDLGDGTRFTILWPTLAPLRPVSDDQQPTSSAASDTRTKATVR